MPRRIGYPVVRLRLTNQPPPSIHFRLQGKCFLTVSGGCGRCHCVALAIFTSLYVWFC